MDKLLPDHPELPPGFPIPKTLVLSLSGVLTHTEYKVTLILLGLENIHDR